MPGAANAGNTDALLCAIRDLADGDEITVGIGLTGNIGWLE